MIRGIGIRLLRSALGSDSTADTVSAGIDLADTTAASIIGIASRVRLSAAPHRRSRAAQPKGGAADYFEWGDG
jgi:hypothetical protein